MLPASETSSPHVLILGGGITGLSTAYHITRRSKDIRVTILEASTRLGGWVDSNNVTIGSRNDPVNVVLESGPRTLRPNSKALLELISLLKLQDQLITVPRTSPAARNRFLYIADSSDGLTILPTPASLASFWTSPVGLTLVTAVFKEFWTGFNRPPGRTDESLDSFLSRRFGDDVARTFASAFVHGIYAADSRKLSTRAAFPSLWDAETRGRGSVIWGFMKSSPTLEDETYGIDDELQSSMKGVSVYSFKRGLSTLIQALEEELRACGQVDIRVGDGAVSVNLGDSVTVQTNSGDVLTATHVISTLPFKTLNAILTASKCKSNEAAISVLSSRSTSCASVYVTNFIFPATEKPIHPAGFGYLIPRPSGGYIATAKNGQGILGVIFDSESLSDQDSDQGHTKMTVISGGPYVSSLSSRPDVEAMLNDVREHLGADYEVPDPIFTKVTECRECIPLYEVGHVEWMEELKNVLENYRRRFHVIGTSIGGVAVPDCVEQGRRAARDVVAACQSIVRI